MGELEAGAKVDEDLGYWDEKFHIYDGDIVLNESGQQQKYLV